MDRFAAYTPDPSRQATLDSYVCPSCGQLGTLRDTVAGWLACSCAWHGEEATVLRQQATTREVAECFAEDQRRGSRGGGSRSGGKRNPKPGDRLLRRPEQDDPPIGPDRPQRTTELVAVKSELVRLRMTPGERVLVDRLAAARGATITDVLLAGLRLVDALTTREWRWWTREADVRGVTPEQLLHTACEEWAALHVPDVPMSR